MARGPRKYTLKVRLYSRGQEPVTVPAGLDGHHVYLLVDGAEVTVSIDGPGKIPKSRPRAGWRIGFERSVPLRKARQKFLAGKKREFEESKDFEYIEIRTERALSTVRNRIRTARKEVLATALLWHQGQASAGDLNAACGRYAEAVREAEEREGVVFQEEAAAIGR